MADVSGAVGETVWARVGSYGWRAAVVCFPGLTRKWVPLEFCSPAGDRLLKSGRRSLSDLMPRDPAAGGLDKPPVSEAWKRAAAPLLGSSGTKEEQDG